MHGDSRQCYDEPMRLVLALGVLGLVAGGCSSKPGCKDDTVLVTLQFAGATTSADSLHVQVTVGAGGFEEDVDRPTGSSQGTLELAFAPGALTGKTIAIDVLAASGGAVIGEGLGSTTVDGRCGSLSITINPSAAPMDMSVADLSVAIDLSTLPDLSTADLTKPPDMAMPLPAPKGYWSFDEAAGTTAADGSGNNNTGTLHGAVHIAGKHGGALDFDGTSAYVDVGNPASLQLTGAMTVSAWVFIDSVASSGRIIAKEGGPGVRSWSLNVESSGIAKLIIASTLSVTLSADTVAAVPTGQWIHLAGVYEPGVAVRIYLNGVLNNSVVTGVPAQQVDNGLNINIGRRPDVGTYFDGRIDEVRIYNLALTGPQITELAF
jgi:hypothetical protein